MIAKLSLFLALADAAAAQPKAGLVPIPDAEQPATSAPIVPIPDAEQPATAAPKEAATQASDAEKQPATGAAAEAEADVPGAEKQPATGAEAETAALEKPTAGAAAAAEEETEKQTCPSHESASTDVRKYPCGYAFANDAVHLYIGRDADNVYIKAHANDARWLAVGPSKAQMGNLSAVVNHEGATADGKGGARFFKDTAAGHAGEWPAPEGAAAFKGTPVMSTDEQGRVIELVFDAAEWATTYASGVSLAWGEDAAVASVAYHGLLNKEFILFNGDDEKYQVPTKKATSKGAVSKLPASRRTPAANGATTTSSRRTPAGPVPNVATTTVAPDEDEEPLAKGSATSSLRAFSALLLLSLCF